MRRLAFVFHRTGWLIGVLLVLWLGGFAWFLGSSLWVSIDRASPTDAIVVLTGGKSRLETGLELLAAGKAGKLFVSGVNPAVQPLWQALYDAGVDVLLTGHDHGYERFAPMDPTGVRDPERGVRQFVVGTGGKSHQLVVEPKPYSEIRDETSFGVLQLTLRPNGYRWSFVPEAGSTFADSGANGCH